VAPARTIWPGFRESLQARREIEGLADDDKPGGNADADAERLRSKGLQARHRCGYFQPRSHQTVYARYLQKL